jgi:hypothetical protein
LGLASLGLWVTTAHAQEQVTLQNNGSTDLQTRAINTWVDQNSPTTPNNTDADLHIEPGDTVAPNVTRRAVLQFDLSRIPRAGIKSALLNIWIDTAPTPNQRRWEVRQVTSFIGFASASNITWNNRTSQLAWTLVGGDFSGTVVGAGTLTGIINGVPLQWDVTTAVQTFFGVKGGPPDPNYGFMIKDQTEKTDNNGGAAEEGQMASNSNTTVAHRPSLVINLIQEVQGLHATNISSNTVTLNWTYPSQIANSTIVNATSGAVILRMAGQPVPDSALLQDGTVLPALCSDVNSSGAIVVGITTGTAFTDPGTCTAPSNGTTYFYKVLAIAQIGATSTYNYSTNGTGSIGSGVDNTFAAEISATPNTTLATIQAPLWVAPVHTASLSAPSIDPGNSVIVATNNDLVQGFDPIHGNDAIAPASVGGTVSSRMPVLEATESDWGTYNNGGTGLPMTFLAASDNLVYDVSLNSSGFVQQFSNPLGTGTPGAYTGGVAMQVKAFSNSGNMKPDDVVIMGTHVTGGPPTVNTIFAATSCGLSVATGSGCPGTGGGWSDVGGAVMSAGCNGSGVTAVVCNIDIVTSTPFVDYKRNTVWVTSHNGNAAAGVAASPDVLKLDANSGLVLAAVNVGGDIDSSPTGTQDQSLIFVGTNDGRLFAYDAALTDAGPPLKPFQVGSASAGLGVAEGPIKGFPLVASSSAPWFVIVSTKTKVTRWDFDGVAFSVIPRWSTSVSGPSAPITGPNLTDTLNNPVILVGGSDGKLHELRVSDGVDEAQRVVDPFGGTVIVGDPSLDLLDSPNEVIVGASDGRVFAFALPF